MLRTNSGRVCGAATPRSPHHWAIRDGRSPGLRNRASSGSKTGTAALERTPFVLGEPAPDTGILTGLQSPGDAGFRDRATTADCLRLLDLLPRSSLTRLGLTLPLRSLALERFKLLARLLQLLLECAMLLGRRAELALKRRTLLGLRCA